MLVKRIGIDLDNTIADFMKGATPLLKDILGIEPKNLSDSWTIEEAFGLSKGRKKNSEGKWEFLSLREEDKKKLLKIRHELYVKRRLFRNLPTIDEQAYKLTDTLAEMGYYIYFITARTKHPTIVEDTYYWLSKNGFMKHYTDLFFTHEKDKLCKLMDIPIIIEDERMQITNCLTTGINVIGRAQPWNKEIDIPEEENIGKYFRIHHWQQMVETVKEIQ